MAVQIIIVQILHHQKSPSIILVCWHHDIVMIIVHVGQSSIIQTRSQQIRPEVAIHGLSVALAICVDAHEQSGWIIQEPLEGSFASGLLL